MRDFGLWDKIKQRFCLSESIDNLDFCSGLGFSEIEVALRDCYLVRDEIVRFLDVEIGEAESIGQNCNT